MVIEHLDNFSSPLGRQVAHKVRRVIRIEFLDDFGDDLIVKVIDNAFLYRRLDL